MCFRPRAVGAPAQIVHRIEPETESRRIGAAENDRACVLPVGDDRAVLLGDDVLKANHAVGRRRALLVDVFLDGNGHAVQRSELFTSRDRRVGAIGGIARAPGQIDRHRIELGVDCGHATEARVQRLTRRDVATTDRRRDASCGPAPDIVAHRKRTTLFRSEWQGLRVEAIPATLARRFSSGAMTGNPAGEPMSLIAVGGFQHETNTFAPSKANFKAFEDGGGWPPLTSGAGIAPRLSGANIPAAGAIDTLHALGHRTVGLVWGAASPSAHVTRDAYERIAGDMLARLQAAGPVDGIYLDLHGAMVTEHLDDGEGELLSRVRRLVGDRVPLVASLDLHANVTQAMIKHCDGLVSYRTYRHVDMAASGERAGHLLQRMLTDGEAPTKSFRTVA